MKVIKYLFCINLIFIFTSPLSAQTKTDAIRLNQVGFYPNGPKLAIVAETSAEQFFVTTPDLKDTVYAGSLGPTRHWQYSDEDVKQADFSELTTKGTFIVVVPNLGYSAPFDIKPRVHQEIARATTKAYYFQRMSIGLAEEFAGKWQRPMGHPDTEVLVHSSAASPERPEGTVLSSPKGWYDAGDYNKYIVNSGISTYTMLAIYEHFPEYCQALETNIPESGNAVPDVLDESLWNIRWMLTMQDPHDGGVYHKCTHANFSGVVMPHQATVPRYVVQKSSTAALDFAAVMAQSARIFREFEVELPGLADSCLTAALAAWDWARKNPDVYYRQNDNNQKYQPSITTGEYGDWDDDDEFKWAAAELYITTKQDSFIAAVDPLSDNSTDVPGWRNVETLGFYTLAFHRYGLSAAVDTVALKNRLLKLADELKTELSQSAYNVMLTSFPWGSNAVAANQSMLMIQAFKLTADSSYLEAAIANLDYLLGRNATTYCFVSDAGDKPPMNFHHRQSEADDVEAPIPGLLAGGPNPSQQDNCPGYPSDLPARSYVDDWCSYASNEICINWNSPIAYAATAIEAIKSFTGKPNTISVEITSPLNEASFESSAIIAISADASIEEGAVARVEFFANGAKIGESFSAPFNFQWQNADPGVYKVRARAVGDMGDFRYSEAINILVLSSESVGDILFVVGSTELNGGDEAIRNFLIKNDYHVFVQDVYDSVVFQIDEKAAILVSSTCGSTKKIRDEILNVDVPLLSWQNSLFDDFGWTGRKSNTDFGRSQGSTIDIVDAAHPIAAGLSGAVGVTTVDDEITWAVPNENARVIACVENDPTKPVIFCYETRSKMLKDMTANARRVSLYYSDESPALLTKEGWKILAGAVNWAAAGERVFVEKNETPAPASHQLGQNYPNPFNPETRIKYILMDRSDVLITIYNSMGQQVATLINEYQSAGTHDVRWDGRNQRGDFVGNGLYFYQLKTGTFEQTRKMIILR